MATGAAVKVAEVRKGLGVGRGGTATAARGEADAKKRGSGWGFGWARDVGVLRGGGSDFRKALLVNFRFARKRASELVQEPMRDGIGW